MRSSARSRRGPQRGVPDNPGAWITTTARNRAIDRLRRRKRLVEKTEVLAREATMESELEAIEPGPSEDAMHIADDRLRLIFTCCHPALAMDARVALTLRTLGGLTTPGDRPGVPRPGADPRPAPRPRQAQDPRRRDPLSRATGRAAARSGSTASCGCCTSCSTRATRRRRAMR